MSSDEDEGIFSQSLLEEVERIYDGADPAHDFSHILRVYCNAKKIGQAEGADMQVLLLAALLHDALEGSKNPCRSLIDLDKKSQQREAVGGFLDRIGLSEEKKEQVLYAVAVHRFSLGIKPETLEAKILQDADRLDALGAVGIARTFMTGGTLNRAFYCPKDPFCKAREPDDRKWNLDHFYRKLLRLGSEMHTRTGKEMAGKRAEVLHRYLLDLEEEIGVDL